MDKRKFFYRTLPLILLGGTTAYLIVNKIRKTVIYNRIMQEGARKESLDTKKLTITDSQASELAEAIYKAFKPSLLGLGTNEDAVKKALDNLTQSDILLVEKKFGTRDGMTMRAYIRDEIDEDSKDYAEIRSLYQKVGLNL